MTLPKSSVALLVSLLPTVAAYSQGLIAQDTLFPVAHTYDSGEFWMANVSGTAWSIAFGSDFRILYVSTRSSLAISPSPPGYNSLTFSLDSIANAGYRTQDSLVAEPDPIGSADTVWAASTRFPDSLIALDTLLDDRVTNAGYGVVGRAARHAYYTQTPQFALGCQTTWMAPASDAILYVQASSGRTYKLQIAGHATDTGTCTAQCCDVLGAAILVRWAADSSGNRFFAAAQAAHRGGVVAHRPRAGGYSAMRTFDILGRRLIENVPSSLRANPFAVQIVVNAPNAGVKRHVVSSIR
jgi:hypothetical protein